MWNGVFGADGTTSSTLISLDFVNNVYSEQAAGLAPENYPMTKVTRLETDWTFEVPSRSLTFTGTYRPRPSAIDINLLDAEMHFVSEEGKISYHVQLRPCLGDKKCLLPTESDPVQIYHLDSLVSLTGASGGNYARVTYSGHGSGGAGKLGTDDPRPYYSSALGLEGMVRVGGGGTQLVTALTVLRLVADGKLSLDAKISTLLPEVPAAYADVTVTHLLTHRSGLPSRIADESAFPAKPISSEDDGKNQRTAYIAEAFKMAPLGKAGEHEAVSDAGYVALGAIVDRVSGYNYEAQAVSVLRALGGRHHVFGCPGQDRFKKWELNTISEPAGHTFSNGVTHTVLPNPDAVCGVAPALASARGLALSSDSALQLVYHVSGSAASPALPAELMKRVHEPAYPGGRFTIAGLEVDAERGITLVNGVAWAGVATTQADGTQLPGEAALAASSFLFDSKNKLGYFVALTAANAADSLAAYNIAWWRKELAIGRAMGYIKN